MLVAICALRRYCRFNPDHRPIPAFAEVDNLHANDVRCRRLNLDLEAEVAACVVRAHWQLSDHSSPHLHFERTAGYDCQSGHRPKS